MSINAFPRIPHLPGSHADFDDLVLDEQAAHAFLDEPVVVYEKLDGMNLAISVERGQLVFALKYDWRRALDGGVERAIRIALRQREAGLRSILDGGGVLYGEWLWHRIHVKYERLPDVFLAFAFQDRRGRLVERERWEPQVTSAGLRCTQPIYQGRLGSVAAVKRLVATSIYGRSRMEGVLLEQPARRGTWSAKWVDASYRHRPKGMVSGERNGLVEKARSILA